MYSPLWYLPGFSGGSGVKNPPVNAGDLNSISGSGTSPGEGHGKNPMEENGKLQSPGL